MEVLFSSKSFFAVLLTVHRVTDNILPINVSIRRLKKATIQIMGFSR